MALFKRFKKQKPEMDDCEHLSALGDDPDAWIGLDDDELKQVLSVKFIEYGATQDGSRIAGLFALYRYSMQRLDVDERRAMLTEFSEMIERHEGLGHMGLMMFLAADIPRPQDQKWPHNVLRHSFIFYRIPDDRTITHLGVSFWLFKLFNFPRL